jgi:hypothetical protein
MLCFFSEIEEIGRDIFCVYSGLSNGNIEYWDPGTAQINQMVGTPLSNSGLNWPLYGYYVFQI